MVPRTSRHFRSGARQKRLCFPPRRFVRCFFYLDQTRPDLIEPLSFLNDSRRIEHVHSVWDSFCSVYVRTARKKMIYLYTRQHQNTIKQYQVSCYYTRTKVRWKKHNVVRTHRAVAIGELFHPEFPAFWFHEFLEICIKTRRCSCHNLRNLTEGENIRENKVHILGRTKKHRENEKNCGLQKQLTPILEVMGK